MPRIVCDLNECTFNGLYAKASPLDGLCLTTSVSIIDGTCQTYQPRKPQMKYGYLKIDCVAKDECHAEVERFEP